MGLVRCEASLYTGFRVCSTASKGAISPTLGITGLDHQFQPGKLHLIEDMAQFNEVQDKSTGVSAVFEFIYSLSLDGAQFLRETV
ncbi:hypothetical protein T09_9321 [Trichinella sp. T9]|nr:hypothetical protein T09_9321 [Trichinella sp. T9]